MRYTKSEMNDRKYTKEYAFNNAKRLLKGRSVCVNAIANIPDDKLFTLVEINELVSEMVADTHYYG